MEGQKGLLAADESTKSANKRLASLGLTPSEQTRQAWRELLLTTPNLSDFISGVILFDETIRQHTSAGVGFAECLTKQGIIPGIKVDLGLVDLTNFPTETVTEGLDGLDSRLQGYYALGARFAKWRAAFTIGHNTPTLAAIHANANVFGRYAALCQANGIVPIIEPEVLYSGSHSLQEAKMATAEVIKTTLDVVAAYRVDMRAVILKTSMVLAGADAAQQSTPEGVATATLEVLHHTVPTEVGGIVYLSGGQSPQQATQNLNAIGTQHDGTPWPMSYSFSRAVQDPVMQAWQGRSENIQKAQKIFYHRLACNSAARSGGYTANMEIFS